MNPTGCIALSAMALTLSGCALSGQGSDPAAPFQGEWVLDKSFGVTPPPALSSTLAATRERVTIRSRWDQPKNGQYGLTLLGVTLPEVVIETTGQQMAAQAGPFVLRYQSRWKDGKLITDWSTSEYMGASFRGVWTRSVTRDGRLQTLDIDAMSAAGQVSRARLIFRRA